MWGELWTQARHRLRKAKSWAKATFCQRTFILRFVLLVLSGLVLVMHGLAKKPPKSNLFGVMMSTVVIPGAAGTAFLIMLTVLIARVVKAPCAPLLVLTWDGVVVALWTVLLIARVVWLVLQWKTGEEGADTSAKALDERRDISGGAAAQVTVEIFEEVLMMVLLMGSVVGQASEVWLDVGEIQTARRNNFTQAMEQERARLRLERRVALRRLRELHEPAPHVHLSLLPASRRTLMRLSEGRISGLEGHSRRGTAMGARGTVSDFSGPYTSAHSQLPGSEERLLRDVTFHDASEGSRSQSVTPQWGSYEHLTGDRPLHSHAARLQPSPSGVRFEQSLLGSGLTEDDGRLQRLRHPAVITEPREGPQPSPSAARFEQSLLGSGLAEDDGRLQRLRHPAVITEPREGPQPSPSGVRFEQSPQGPPSPPRQLYPETLQLQEPTHPRTACGKCVPPAETTAFAPPLLRLSKNAMNLSKGATLPDVVVPQEQPFLHPYERFYQRKLMSQQPVRERTTTACRCHEVVGNQESREPGTERGDFREKPTQDQHLQQQTENKDFSESSCSSWKSATSKERSAAKVTVAPEIVEANVNPQNQLLNNPQVPNQEKKDSNDQETNVHSSRLPILPDVTTPSKDIRVSISISITPSNVNLTTTTSNNIG